MRREGDVVAGSAALRGNEFGIQTAEVLHDDGAMSRYCPGQREIATVGDLDIAQSADGRDQIGNHCIGLDAGLRCRVEFPCADHAPAVPNCPSRGIQADNAAGFQVGVGQVDVTRGLTRIQRDLVKAAKRLNIGGDRADDVSHARLLPCVHQDLIGDHEAGKICRSASLDADIASRKDAAVQDGVGAGLQRHVPDSDGIRIHTADPTRSIEAQRTTRRAEVDGSGSEHRRRCWQGVAVARRLRADQRQVLRRLDADHSFGSGRVDDTAERHVAACLDIDTVRSGNRFTCEHTDGP
ncbi:MAG: hypothetical protein AW11_01363 [Candidatus Accumulibacter regalis]|uniref:Uncharacterized protein n=1 Tax=Accumulibacter regalis TaxID=522306 RepID=A0A011QKX0_ACCRE|nr:MAG: hypothetical protein AW11_01363 [Candidatus Accumulibacter regalis]